MGRGMMSWECSQAVALLLVSCTCKGNELGIALLAACLAPEKSLRDMPRAFAAGRNSIAFIGMSHHSRP